MYNIQIMHDEVSETENIRKNLAIERMITEGCDILLDTSQVFVRQGMRLTPVTVNPPLFGRAHRLQNVLLIPKQQLQSCAAYHS